MISIIIPVFNSEKYLKECIDSCLNQTYKNLEVICINAGDKDNSLEILKEYAKKDKRVSVIHELNLGIGASRNLGVEKSKGDFLFFLDSDDFLELNTFEILHKQMIEDDSDIIFFNTYWNYESAGRKEIKSINSFRARFNKSCFRAEEAWDILFDTTVCPFKMYRKDVWVQNGVHYSEHRLSEDALPHFQFLSNTKKISICNYHLYNYRKHPESSTANMDEKFTDNFSVFCQCEEMLEKSKNYNFLIHSFLQNRLKSMSFWFGRLKPEYKKRNWTRTKQFFKYVTNKYSKETIEQLEEIEMLKNVAKYSSYGKYCFFKKTKTFLTILKSHYL